MDPQHYLGELWHPWPWICTKWYMRILHTSSVCSNKKLAHQLPTLANTESQAYGTYQLIKFGSSQPLDDIGSNIQLCLSIIRWHLAAFVDPSCSGPGRILYFMATRTHFFSSLSNQTIFSFESDDNNLHNFPGKKLPKPPRKQTKILDLCPEIGSNSDFEWIPVPNPRIRAAILDNGSEQTGSGVLVDTVEWRRTSQAVPRLGPCRYGTHLSGSLPFLLRNKDHITSFPSFLQKNQCCGSGFAFILVAFRGQDWPALPKMLDPDPHWNYCGSATLLKTQPRV